MSTRALDRSRPPEPGRVHPFRFPDVERRSLPGGMTLLAAPLAGARLVYAEVLLPAGAQYDPPPKAGLATLTAGLLDEGCGERSALEIAAAIEGLGGHLTTGASWDVASTGVELEGRHLTAGLELLAEVVTAPTFPEEELQRGLRRRAAELVRRRAEPTVQATLWTGRAIYGDSHPYGRSAFGSEESVAGIARGDVTAFYRRCYPLAGATLVAVGDFTPAELAAAAGEAFPGTGGGELPVPPELPAPAAPARRVVVVDRPGAAQTELRVATAALPRRHPDFLPLKVLNCLLGGKFTSRLNLNLRERHGFTYGVYSGFALRQGPGPFMVSAGVDTAVAGRAVEEILRELEALGRAPVSEVELADAQSYLIGTFPVGLQTVSGMADRLAELAIHGLPADTFQHHAQEIRAVTPDDLLALSRRYLDPGRMAIVAVGPGESLRPQLAPFGHPEVVEPV